MLRTVKQRLALVLRVARYGHLGKKQAEPLQQISAEDLAEIENLLPDE